MKIRNNGGELIAESSNILNTHLTVYQTGLHLNIRMVNLFSMSAIYFHYYQSYSPPEFLNLLNSKEKEEKKYENENI